jgi:hypothetical protein
MSPFREPMPSEPSGTDGMDEDDEEEDATEVEDPAIAG